MNRRTILLATISLIAFTCDRGGGAQPGPAIGSGQRPLPENDNANKRAATVVTSVLDYMIEDGRNVIWCASFQLAWNELRDVVIKSDVMVIDGPEWVSILNSKAVTKDDLSPEAYVALVGRKEDRIVDRINEELQRKFAPPVAELREGDLGPKTIIAFAYMRKALRFAEAFDSCKEPMRFQAGSKGWNVACFGVDASKEESDRSRAMRRQVSVWSSRDEECILKLSTEGDRDEIILAKTTPGRTLSATIDQVLDTIQKKRPYPLYTRVPVWIPKVSFNLERSFDELIGKFIGNPGWNKWYFSVAKQHTQFDLDERGALLSSEAQIHLKSRRGYGQFVFDRPFLILLRQASRERPYFAAWIANGELLAKP